MDATMHAAVFHLQNKHYDGARPPSFFDHDELNKLNLTRARQRRGVADHCAGQTLKSVYDCEKEPLVNSTSATSDIEEAKDGNVQRNSFTSPRPLSPISSSTKNSRWGIVPPTPEITSQEMLQRTALNAAYFPAAQLPNQNFACRPEQRTPPLFLQELAHLSSLACAVALSTLRNDIEGMESPLDVYAPESPLPVADPDMLPETVRREFQHRFRTITILRNWMGNDRLPTQRNKYNAARPLVRPRLVAALLPTLPPSDLNVPLLFWSSSLGEFPIQRLTFCKDRGARMPRFSLQLAG